MRYVFDSPGLARRHVHFLDGRQLIFFPDLLLDVRAGQPIIVEICFGNADQSLTARGEVFKVETGAIRGAWLEIFSLRLYDALPLAAGPQRRMFPRLPTDMLVRTRRPGATSAVARLIEISAGGARITTSGEWTAGEKLFVSDLSGGPSLRGKVVRVQGHEVAVAFDRLDATTRRNAVRLVESAVGRWRDAHQARHQSHCGCGRGAALAEPLLPQPARQRAEGL